MGGRKKEKNRKEINKKETKGMRGEGVFTEHWHFKTQYRHSILKHTSIRLYESVML
jgi:hypothetical protein